MNSIPCPDLVEAIAFFTEKLGFRLDMITPSDSPRTAVVSRAGLELRLEQTSDEKPRVSTPRPSEPIICRANDSQWIVGRAGMEYRDLIPDRLGGRVIASHIRLAQGGEVPDYVHYHKIGFQMIFCKVGRIRVVYQNQGTPFWLEPGDCVLQPPEIRHRVLEAEAGSEVLEVGCPAVHETWVDHEIMLSDTEIDPDRVFGGQSFVRHIASQAVWERKDELTVRDTGIRDSTGGLAEVAIVKNADESATALARQVQSGDAQFHFVLAGSLVVNCDSGPERKLQIDDSFTTSGPAEYKITPAPHAEWLQVTLALDDLLSLRS